MHARSGPVIKMQNTFSIAWNIGISGRKNRSRIPAHTIPPKTALGSPCGRQTPCDTCPDCSTFRAHGEEEFPAYPSPHQRPVSVNRTSNSRARTHTLDRRGAPPSIPLRPHKPPSSPQTRKTTPGGLGNRPIVRDEWIIKHDGTWSP